MAKSRQQAPSQPPLSVEDQIIVSELQKFVAGDDIVKLLQTSVSSREIPVATSDITVRDKFGQVIFINANGESAWAFVKLIEQLEKTGGLKSILETTLATQPDIVNLLWFNYVKVRFFLVPFLLFMMPLPHPLGHFINCGAFVPSESLSYAL